MKHPTTPTDPSPITIGLDLGDRRHTAWAPKRGQALWFVVDWKEKGD